MTVQRTIKDCTFKTKAMETETRATVASDFYENDHTDMNPEDEMLHRRRLEHLVSHAPLSTGDTGAGAYA
jgi:hypothetical protein